MTSSTRPPAWLSVLGAAALALGALTGCTGASSEDPTGAPAPPEASPNVEETVPPEDQDEQDEQEEQIPLPDVPDVPRVAVDDVTVVASDLDVPWGMALLDDGELLVTQRGRAGLVRVDLATGRKTEVTGEGARALREDTVTDGEGGLLGLALSPTFGEDHEVFLYRTTEDGNQVLRGTLNGSTLGELTPILSGIPAAQNHNGGALGFGPDGHLFIGTGDADEPDQAQNIDSLAGKILRIDRDGGFPATNPMPLSPVWTLGHRNVQGFDWDVAERMYAAEFGASYVDELNMIESAGNYGWPVVEGPGGVGAGFVDPLVSWPTDQASPSGLAVSADGIYLAGLRGQSLWRVPLFQVVTGAEIHPEALLEGDYGRLRNVLLLTGGDLLVVTSNTDGRGDPNDDDDVLLRVSLVAQPAPEADVGPDGGEDGAAGPDGGAEGAVGPDGDEDEAGPDPGSE